MSHHRAPRFEEDNFKDILAICIMESGNTCVVSPTWRISVLAIELEAADYLQRTLGDRSRVTGVVLERS
ncbi:MAG: hypothetical protein ACR2MY_09090 [Candidatus Dormibacteria bacterium]